MNHTRKKSYALLITVQHVWWYQYSMCNALTMLEFQGSQILWREAQIKNSLKTSHFTGAWSVRNFWINNNTQQHWAQLRRLHFHWYCTQQMKNSFLFHTEYLAVVSCEFCTRSGRSALDLFVKTQARRGIERKKLLFERLEELLTRNFGLEISYRVLNFALSIAIIVRW